MAVYEYLCPKCRKEFELMRPISEADKAARCPKCGSKAVKLISGFASKTGDSIQAPGKPFRARTAAKGPAHRSKIESGKAAASRGRKSRTRK
jgi:putative FmdB family regulatory protein